MNIKIPRKIKNTLRKHFNKHKKSKMSFASKGDAEAFIKKEHANDNTIEPYWCNYCCHWHVGHKL